MSSATYNNQRERFFKAALENNIPELKVLLENGYRINRGDGDLYTALHRVCEHWTDKINNKNGQNKLSSSYNTATFLVSNGADVNADNPATDGWTPLHLSCWAGSIGAVQFLIDNGARVNNPEWYVKSSSDPFDDMLEVYDKINGDYKDNELVNEVIKFIEKDKKRPICLPQT